MKNDRGGAVSRNPTHAGPKRGFTLIELLVAIAVLASIAVLGWRALDSITRARIALNEEMEQARSMHLSFAQMHKDFEQIAAPAVMGARPRLQAEGGRLALVRTVTGENQPTQLQVVAYRIRDDVLTRYESATTRDMNVLDALWSATTTDVEIVQEVPLLKGIASMTLRAWVNDGAGWRDASAATERVMIREGNSWRPAGPNDNAANLAGPSGMEVVLQLRRQNANISKVFILGAT